MPGDASMPAVALVILDGWGCAPPGPGNAISLAQTPVLDALCARYPHARLQASGRAVGLPEGQMGNSEVGHLTLGAGAAIPQELTRIDDAVARGELAANRVLADAMSNAPRVHLIGLVSDGGVHSGYRHLRALIDLAALHGVNDLVLHAFTDGRDTPPTAGADFLAEVESWMTRAGTGRIGSVVGRYYAMDRDRRWPRVQRAYDLLVCGSADHHAGSGEAAVRGAYSRGETDEFVMPVRVGEEARIRPGDSVIAFNFRPDRMREITRALADPGLEEISRDGVPPISRYVTMTPYVEGWPYPVVFPPVHPATTLPRVLEEQGTRQLHVAETEKYAHVTYFFNGGEEAACRDERRVLIPSPRDVATYDLKPEMSARGVAQAFADRWHDDAPRFGVVNFANADMVGHTGDLRATIRAVETADRCVGAVIDAVQASGGVCIVTADHGNAECMLADGGGPNTAHSTNPVPVVVTVPGRMVRDGTLADVAPTVLELLGLPRPAPMTGTSLFVG